MKMNLTYHKETPLLSFPKRLTILENDKWEKENQLKPKYGIEPNQNKHSYSITPQPRFSILTNKEKIKTPHQKTYPKLYKITSNNIKT